MKLAILTGGKGTRLGFKDIPKPMVKIAGKSILEHQISLVKRYDIKDIYFLSGYLGNLIADYFGNGESFGVRIHHLIEEKPLGTAGAVKLLEKEINERFLVMYGDIILDFNINAFIDFDKKHTSIASILVHPNDHPHDSDLLEIDSNSCVTAFHSKPHMKDIYYSNLVNAAVYILSPEIFRYIHQDEHADFGKDIFPALLKMNKNIFAYNTPEYIKDMGTPDRMQKVEKDILSKKVYRLNIENKQKAVFIDRDGVLNYDTDSIRHEDQLELIPGAAKAVKMINESDYLAVLVTNQPGIAKGFVTEQGLKKIHNKLEHLLGLEGAYIDRIYYCPHHPEKGFEGERIEYKIDCDCRKPKTGMIMEAKKDLNIDLESSFIIGDSFRDILCGNNAGLTAIAVRTGTGLKNKYAEPDYFFDDLIDAVSFLINDPYERYYSDINNIYKKKKGQLLICIGGISRSGKSILAEYLLNKFTEEHVKVLIISLDNWLLPEEKRLDSYNVYDRFQISKINADFNDFLKGIPITVSRYIPLTRNNNDSEITYTKDGFDIIIIEGVVALSSEVIRKNSDIKIFCENDETVFHSRFAKFYEWKGLSDNEIKNIYSKRSKDEYSLILKDKCHADIIINSAMEIPSDNH